MPPKSSTKLYLVQVADTWHYRRRVPKKVAALDGRKFVKQSTEQTDHIQAAVVARAINASTEKYWDELLDGSKPSAAENAHAAAVRRARGLGFDYREAAGLADGPLREILDRVTALQQTGHADNPAMLNAVLGGEDVPAIMLSSLSARFFEATTVQQRDKRPDTLRNWKNLYRLAGERAVEAIGDKPLTSILRSDAVRFRDALLQMVDDGEIKPPRANKMIGALGTMTQTVSDYLDLGLDQRFGKLKMIGAEAGKRPSFDAGYVASTLLGPTALKKMHKELRATIALIASTGVRPIEVARMRGSFVLDHEIPHMRIRPDGDGAKAAAEAGLKVRHTARDIPLCGSALAAARVYPDGLKHFANRQDHLTSMIGDYFLAHKLKPTPGHSLYSLRHTFKDRLRAAKCPDAIVDALMGHGSKKPAYGEGYPLEVLAEWVERVAFDAPEWLR